MSKTMFVQVGFFTLLRNAYTNRTVNDDPQHVSGLCQLAFFPNNSQEELNSYVLQGAMPYRQ